MTSRNFPYNLFFTLQMCWTVKCLAQRPNIIFIMADDLGYQDVGFRGSSILTPNIDKLASAGVILQNHYVMPQCSPTRASFMTGKSPVSLGTWFGNLKPGQMGGLDVREVTMGDMLGGYGYKTHLVGKWHLGMYAPEYTPVNRGFNTFLGMYLGSGHYFNHTNGGAFDLRFNYKNANGTLVDKLKVNMEGDFSTHIYSNRTIDIIKEHSNLYENSSSEPFFIYLSFQAPHGPYMVPKKYKNTLKNEKATSLRRTYAGMVNCMDEGIGRILKALETHKVLDNTLIAFSSDNGAILNKPGSNFPLRGGKKDYFEGGIRSVSFVYSKILETTGYVNKHLHHVMDWFPTFEFLASGVDRTTRSMARSKDMNGVNIWNSINSGIKCRDALLINIQRTDRFTSAWGSTGEEIDFESYSLLDHEENFESENGTESIDEDNGMVENQDHEKYKDGVNVVHSINVVNITGDKNQSKTTFLSIGKNDSNSENEAKTDDISKKGGHNETTNSYDEDISKEITDESTNSFSTNITRSDDIINFTLDWSGYKDEQEELIQTADTTSLSKTNIVKSGIQDSQIQTKGNFTFDDVKKALGHGVYRKKGKNKNKIRLRHPPRGRNKEKRAHRKSVKLSRFSRGDIYKPVKDADIAEDTPEEKRQFENLIVYIWGSWKIIVGNQKILKSGWSVRDSGRSTLDKSGTTVTNSSNTVFLYELQSDPREQRNIAKSFPGMVEEMLFRVEKYFWDKVEPIVALRSSSEGKKTGVWRPWVKNRLMINYTDVT